MAAHPASPARSRRAPSARRPLPSNVIALPQDARPPAVRRPWRGRSPGNVIPFSRRPRLRPGDLAIFWRSRGPNEGLLVRIREWADPRLKNVPDRDWWLIYALDAPMEADDGVAVTEALVAGRVLRRVSNTLTSAREVTHA